MEIDAIAKIKYTEKKGVEIHYTSGDNEYTLKCPDIPSPEFISALHNFLKDVVVWCRLGDDWEEMGEVTGLTIKDSPEGHGVTITAMLLADNKAINVNSPYLSPNDITADLSVKLVQMIEQAKKYVKGDRAQLALEV